MTYQIEKINIANFSEAKRFLESYEDFSFFLLGNLEEFGYVLNDSPNSGNFKIVRENGSIVCIFCLTLRCNLLVQSTIQEPLFELIIAECKKESMPIKGLIADWTFAAPFWKFLKTHKIIQKEDYRSKEILYSLDLTQTFPQNQYEVRSLEKSDYLNWKQLRLLDYEETKIPLNISEEQMYNLYVVKSNQKLIWGCFLHHQMVAKAEIIARSIDMGVLGGVYTIPKFRKKGIAKSLLHQLIEDLRMQHNFRKLIIFTGQHNTAARRLYESLNAQHVGYISLLFGGTS
jgi:predicted GNAT family acetyltransferase